VNSLKGKKVLVTGHTGFKGSWLSAWLKLLGCKIIGLSDRVPTSPSHFGILDGVIDLDLRLDISDVDDVCAALSEIKPDLIFHLAAQPIVFDAYEKPFETFKTNVLGTATILEYLKNCNHNCCTIFITSDKCYDNVEWTYGYREDDRLGGKDPYSGSKGAAELAIKSYFESFISKLYPNVKIAVGRAGNVIGGGDWAPFRIVPDCVRSWSKFEKPEIRNPFATRPWQHVLEPLSGYLTLAVALINDHPVNGEAFNFGPSANQNHSVKDLVEEIMLAWKGTDWVDKSGYSKMPSEAGLLKLCCDKALHTLNWEPTLNFSETAKWTAEWYRTYYESGEKSAQEITQTQIIDFMSIAKNRKSFEIYL
jgi:CDP-glucose 4,6-dehydratase